MLFLFKLKNFTEKRVLFQWPLMKVAFFRTGMPTKVIWYPKNRILNSLIIDVIVGIILILYIIFLYLDFYNIKFFINSYYIKYLCVLFCFLLCLRINKNSFTNIFNHRDIFLLQLAMLITVISDLCLVIFDFYILGVFLFSLLSLSGNGKIQK